MKRLLLAVTVLLLVLPCTRKADGRTDISIDFFYDNLGSDGNWVDVADYGYCWQPSIAVNNFDWRPYADGYWAYTDVGWTWVSYEDFGWATYHYGRWMRLRDYGWLWVPGFEWGPAWVSWRTGGNYVGWAPLPPEVGRFEWDYGWIGGQVDLQFDIGPAYYNFIDIRYFGEPVLRERIFAPSLNVTCIHQTVNVTNITYVNSTVYNYGPNYDRLSEYSTRPIRRMTLERDANLDLNAAVKSNRVTRVQGDKLIVAAPLTVQKPQQAAAPKMVKEKIGKPAVEHGWKEIADQKTRAELKQKMKSEDPKVIPPATFKPHEDELTAKNPRPMVPGDSRKPSSSSLVNSPDGTPFRDIQEKGPGVKKNRLVPNVTRRPNNLPMDRAPGKPRIEPDSAPFGREPSPEKPPKPLPPPEQMAPPVREAPPQKMAPKQFQPQRVPSPNRQLPSDVPAKQFAPPPQGMAPPDAPPRRLPPNRNVPVVPQGQPGQPAKRLPPPERMAPPPGPGLKGSANDEAPRGKQAPKQKPNETVAPPGS